MRLLWLNFTRPLINKITVQTKQVAGFKREQNCFRVGASPCFRASSLQADTVIVLKKENWS